MSDVWEDEISEKKFNSTSHKTRRIFGYLWAALGTMLVFYYAGLLLF